ncbi:asparaginase [Noviherbaspirillum aridicola]|uniref:Asparaginase n=1 Tax=Noviherbaspirillum aridicola TaxID=2849687 RepID=A0ABQ4Q0X5_9BURK|nr:asparaginase [Noviherbaspirillum aridicola]GIZ50832.1 asparaginase [Noviherbaspirillum aridicola]
MIGQGFDILAESTRGGHVESVHAGAVAVVDTAGRLLYSAGDPDFPAFTRSTIKPFQALPLLRAGGHEKFRFGSREIALLCASHSGEDMHTSVVQRMLHEAGCDEHHLRCGCHVPLRYGTGEAPPAGMSFNQLHNNCSGKHAGFLAYCVQHGLPLDSYLDPSHPLQQAVRRSVASAARLPETALITGTDGCSAPNFALPLSRLAHAYARLSQGEGDTEAGDLYGLLFAAMTGHPELVSGSGRGDLAFMRTAPGDWVAKGGAEAVQVLGIRSAGIGIAVKIADGGARALYPATIAVLRDIGLLPDPSATPLREWEQPALKNLRGLQTGVLRATLRLRRH